MTSGDPPEPLGAPQALEPALEAAVSDLPSETGAAPEAAPLLAVEGPPPSAGPSEAEPASLPFAAPSWLFLVVATGISLAADLSTKWWAKETLSGPGRSMRRAKRLEVIDGYFDFIFAQNPGGAWSFLRGLPDTLRRPFFLIVSASAIVFIVTVYRRVRPDQTAMKWGLPLALGGAMGNLVDRMRYGWVVDFIDFYVTRNGDEHHWPTFNVADIAIVAGVVLMGYEMLRRRRETPPPVALPLPAAEVVSLPVEAPREPEAPAPASATEAEQPSPQGSP